MGQNFGHPCRPPFCMVSLFNYLLACLLACVCVCLKMRAPSCVKTERYVHAHIFQTKFFCTVWRSPWNMFSKGTASLIFRVDQHIFQPHDLGRGATITLWMKRASILLWQFRQSSSWEHMIWSICYPYDSSNCPHYPIIWFISECLYFHC